MVSLESEISVSAMEDIEPQFFDNFEEPSKEPLITDNYLHLDESSFNQGLGFLNF